MRFKIPACLFALLALVCSAYAKDAYLFQGRVNSNGINVRADSTPSAEVICTVDTGETVEVITELYGWYKIKLPADAPAFIHKKLVVFDNNNTAKVAKNNVNIRLKPNIASAILGRLKKGVTLKILGIEGDWYRIEPPAASRGWIYKSFVDKIEPAPLSKDAVIFNNHIEIEGTLREKIFTRVATHKLLTEDNKLYLLNSAQADLYPFNRRWVKVSGRIVDPAQKMHPLVEVEKIEALN